MTDDQDLGLVEQLADEFAERLRRGEHPSVKEYADRYPQHADMIRDTFEALAMMENLSPESDDSFGLATQADQLATGRVRLQQVGDYRIIREVGRGGMGVVYEAEQVSLGRHVALKVLPKHLLDNPKHRSRFEREAKAAAKLHHTNIVPVFGVGECDGQGYYVMQFIQGLALDEVLDELKHLSANSETPTGKLPGRLQATRRDVSAADVARSLLTGQDHAAAEESADAPQQHSGFDETVVQDAGQAVRRAEPSGSTSAGRLSDTFSISDSSVVLPGSGWKRGHKSPRKQTYWESVARIGTQVADALEYAHGQGILHRDIKPANLLLDLRGTVWVTDFGLAKLEDDRDLTNTGDILGTLRYMAPETFKGQADARSEVYSVGLTLYELLAFRPAFQQTDRSSLVDQVINARVEPLGKLNRDIPTDLQTIVHKAIGPEPEHRYQSAKDLADDLQRFVDDEPIRARRVSLPERMARWARRNRSLAASLWAVASLVALLAIGATIAAIQFRTLAQEQAETARRETEARIEAGQSQSAAEVAKRKAETAEVRERQQRLQVEKLAYESLLGEARALRLARIPGYRSSVWARLQQALALDTPAKNLDEVRREAIACMGDFVALTPQSQSLPQSSVSRVAVDQACSRFAVFLDGGAVTLRALESGEELGLIPPADDDQVDPRRDLFRFKDKNADGALSEEECGPYWTAFSKADLNRNGKLTRVELALNQLLPGASVTPSTKRVAQIHFGISGTVLTQTPGVLRIWRADDDGIWRQIRSFSSVMRSWTSTDGRYIAMDRFGEVAVWDLSTEQMLTSFMAPGIVASMAVSPDAKLIAMACISGKERFVRVREVASGEAQFTLPDVEAETMNMTFSSDGTRLGWANVTGVSVFGVPGYERLLRIGGYCSSISFDPSGQMICFSNRQLNLVRIWNVATNHQTAALPHPRQPYAVRWSHDGDRLVSVGSREVRVWSPTSTPEQRVIRGHAAGVAGIKFSPDGKLLASTSKDRTIKIWDATTGKVHAAFDEELPGPGQCVAFSPDGRYLASGDYSAGSIWIWDVDSGSHRLSLEHSCGPRIWSVAFSPDGRLFAAAGISGVGIWSVTRNDSEPGIQMESISRQRTPDALHLCFTPDSKLLAWTGERTRGDRGRARLWSVSQSRVIFSSDRRLFNPIQNFSFFPDSKQFIFINSRRVAETWSVEGKQIGSFLAAGQPGAGSFSCKTLISPDGHLFAASSVSGSGVNLWEAASGKLLMALPESEGSVWHLDWTADSRRLAISLSLGDIVIWNIAQIRSELARINLDW